MSNRDMPPSPVHWAYANTWLPEAPAISTARRHAESENTAAPSPALGAALRLLASLVDARHVIEVGTGTGVSGAWLLDGMPAEGALTTIDPDPGAHAAAQDTFAAMDIDHTRTRIITGTPDDVLPRMTDGGYDLFVVTPSAPASLTDHAILEAARRLLRPGGALVVCTDLEGSHRDVAATVREEPGWDPALLTIGDGLLVAVWRPVSDVPSPSEVRP